MRAARTSSSSASTVKVYAMRNKCIHRGVKLSRKIECYTKGTITCWYHGFTYKWDTGVVCDIIAVPNSPVIGLSARLRFTRWRRPRVSSSFFLVMTASTYRR